MKTATEVTNSQLLLESLAQRGFYGSISLKFEQGKIVHIRKEQNPKPTELSENLETTLDSTSTNN